MRAAAGCVRDDHTLVGIVSFSGDLLADSLSSFLRYILVSRDGAGERLARRGAGSKVPRWRERTADAGYGTNARTRIRRPTAGAVAMRG